MASDPSIDQQLSEFLNHSDAAIIDLRSSLDFFAGHCVNASHFFIDDLVERLFELPKRDCPLRIVGNSIQRTQAKQLLQIKGYQIVAELDWCEQNQIQVEQKLRQRDLWQQGDRSLQLWSPAKIVKKFQQLYLQQNKDQIKPTLLDLACGSGRDAVYMAMQGWQVTAVDYLADALSKVERLASRHQLVINTQLIDLEKDSVSLIQQAQQYDCVQVIRYLHRPLLEIIKQKIKPGGYLIYQTFSQGCEVFGAPKKSRYILKHGELAAFFSEFEIIIDEIEYLADGRPTNRFIARKVM